MLNKLRELKKKYTLVVVFLCAIICSVILVTNVLQVIFRYVAHHSFVFTEDVSVIGMLWIMGMGISIGTLHHDHLMINIIDSLVSKKAIKVIEFIVDVILIFFGIAMVYFGRLSLLANKGFTQSMLGFDESFRYWPVVVGGVFTALAGLECVVEQILVWRKEKKR